MNELDDEEEIDFDKIPEENIGKLIQVRDKTQMLFDITDEVSSGKASNDTKEMLFALFGKNESILSVHTKLSAALCRIAAVIDKCKLPKKKVIDKQELSANDQEIIENYFKSRHQLKE
jgi:hypothetical protein